MTKIPDSSEITQIVMKCTFSVPKTVFQVTAPMNMG